MNSIVIKKIKYIFKLMFKKKNSPNIFLYHTLFSNIPTICAISAIPLSMVFQDQKNISVEYVALLWIGISFMALRIGSIVGGYALSYLSFKFENRKICALVEFFNFVISIFLIGSLKFKSPLITCLLLFIRGFNQGIFTIARYGWIKQFESHSASRVIILIKNLTQASYGVAGIMVYLINLGMMTPFDLLLVDAITSLLGFFFFLTFVESQQINLYSNYIIDRKWSLTKFQFKLIGLDFILAVAMGGTNSQLVRYGERYFSNLGGYGLTLGLYSIAYLVTGFLRRKSNVQCENLNRFLLNSLLIIFGFVAIWQVPILWIKVFGFLCVFWSYAEFGIDLEVLWYRHTTTEDVSTTMSHRSAVIGTVLAIFEPVYSQASNDIALRLLAIIIFVFLIYAFIYNKLISFRSILFRE